MDLPHLPSQVGFGSCLIEVKITFSTHISLGGASSAIRVCERCDEQEASRW